MRAAATHVLRCLDEANSRIHFDILPEQEERLDALMAAVMGAFKVATSSDSDAHKKN